MKKIFVVAGLCCLLLGNSYAVAAEKYEHYIFRYDSGDTYDVQLTDNTITWLGIEGSGKGHKETDLIKRKQLTNDIEVVQWSELDGTFVTVVLDREHLKVVSSGKTISDSWISSGIAEVK